MIIRLSKIKYYYRSYIILKSTQNLMADLDYNNIHSDPLNLAGVGQIAGHTAVILDSIDKVKLIQYLVITYILVLTQVAFKKRVTWQ